jgi:hypothetical protein
LGSGAAAQPPAGGECSRAAHEASRLRKANRLVDARAELQRCAQSDCAPNVRRDCERKLRELEATMPSITVSARDEAGRGIGDATVSVDERPVANGLDGKPIFVDPGSHVVAVTPKNGATMRRTILVREKDKTPLEFQATVAAPAAATSATRNAASSSASSTAESGSLGHTAGPWVPMVAGGLLTTSAVISLAGAKHDPSPGAYVAGAAGLASIGGGLAWYFVEAGSPSVHEAAPWITTGYGGALVAAGVITGLARASLPPESCQPTAADYRACVDAYHEEKVRHDGVVSTQVAFLIMGGASIAIGTTWALLDTSGGKQATSSTGTRVSLVPGGVAGVF